MGFQQTSDFTSYVPQTHDPGWAKTTSIVVVFNVCISLTLPLLLWFYKRDGKQKPSAVSTPLQPCNDDTCTTRKGAEEDDIGIVGNESSIVSTPTMKSPGSVVSDGYSTFDDGSSTISQAIAQQILLVRAHPKKHRIRTRSYASNATDESITNGLEHDTVSVQDAVDAGEDEQPATAVMESEEKTSLFSRLLLIADVDDEMKKLFSLALPYSVQGLSNGIFDIADVAIIGHFLGVTEANAAITVAILIEFTTTFTYGFSEGKTIQDKLSSRSLRNQFCLILVLYC